MRIWLNGASRPARTEAKSVARATLLIVALASLVTPAAAQFGYCFTQGLLGGTKVFVHDAVREANVAESESVNAYRDELENLHRFRFGSVTCPSFVSEVEAQQHFAGARTLALREGFAEFIFPARRD
ncbi:MAG: hypothetical protein WAK01_04260 [Methylocystis sp.]